MQQNYPQDYEEAKWTGAHYGIILILSASRSMYKRVLVNGWVDICIFFSDAQPLAFLAEYHATWRHIHIRVRSGTNISLLWADLGVLRGDCPLPHPHPHLRFL